MASKLGLLVVSLAFLLLCSSHYCSASGRLLNPEKPASVEFGIDTPCLLKPTFPLPENQETQTPPGSTLPALPMPLEQPTMTPPPPASLPPCQDEANLTPAFPFPHLPSLPTFPHFPFIPALPLVPLDPQFVDSGFTTPGIGDEGEKTYHAGGDWGKGKSGSEGILGMPNGGGNRNGGNGSGMFRNGAQFFTSPKPILALILSTLYAYHFPPQVGELNLWRKTSD